VQATVGVALFQFQYGSIKRIPSITKTPRLSYFNSNMVRLKVQPFQVFDLNICDFNSNMVRLKVLRQSGELTRSGYFNSNMVRLKDTIVLSTGDSFYYFNSNMVRLKVYDCAFNRRQLLLFQFQYGSIKRRFFKETATGYLSFQFQYGSIKSQ